MLTKSVIRLELALVAPLEARPEPRQDLVADRPCRRRDLVERDGPADELDVVADRDRSGRQRGDVDASQVHRYAPDDRQPRAAESRVADVAGRARIAVRVAGGQHGEPGRRPRLVSRAVSDG